jgi:hypothetical protein
MVYAKPFGFKNTLDKKDSRVVGSRESARRQEARRALEIFVGLLKVQAILGRPQAGFGVDGQVWISAQQMLDRVQGIHAESASDAQAHRDASFIQAIHESA